MFNSVRIGDVDLYDEYGCILKHVEIGAPTVQTKYVSVPLKNGDLDFTQLLTKKVKYGDRTLKIDLKYIGEDLMKVQSDIANYLHGQLMQINLDEDPFYFYLGRVALAQPPYEVTNYGGLIHLTAKCDPFKYTYSDNDWLWDPFDFENGYINEFINVVVEGTKSITIIGDAADVYPIITSDSQMDVTYKNKTVTILSGTTTMYDFQLEEGENVLTFTGNGRVTIEYRGGRL